VAVPTLLLLAAGSRSTGLALIGLAVYGLGAPINHLAHDNVGRGVASLALRVGSLASSYAILVETFSGRCGNDEVAHPSYCDWGVGAALALPIAAAILDDVLFARAPRADAAPARVSFVPGLAFAGGAAVMSLGGRF
jgi:hypothetical protein